MGAAIVPPALIGQGDRVAIAAQLGGGDAGDRAIVDFFASCAGHNEHHHHPSRPQSAPAATSLKPACDGRGVTTPA